MPRDDSEFEALQEKLEKLERRQKRNQRASWAEGYLLGVTAMLKPGDLVLDCGANVGKVSEFLLQTGADVICFEPDPYAFEQLQKRLGDHPRADLRNVAVGTSEGVLPLMRADNFDDNPGGASVKSTLVQGGRKIDESQGNVINVPVIDFPAFLASTIAQRGEIAFVKMDIEGAELELLEAMEQTDVFDHIRSTVVETHENKFKELRPRFKTLKGRISDAYPITKINLDWI